MAVERALVKEIADRFGKASDAAMDVIVRVGEIKLWAGIAKKDVEKAKDADLERIVGDALEKMIKDKDSTLKEAKAVETHVKELQKLFAELKKAK
jgi:hypothetical protein